MSLLKDDVRANMRKNVIALNNSANSRIDGLAADKVNLVAARDAVTADAVNFTQADIDDINTILTDTQTRITNEL
jgi:hypothetical protein